MPKVQTALTTLYASLPFNESTEINFKNGSYLQAFFKDYQLVKSETQLTADTRPLFAERLPVRSVPSRPMLAASLQKLRRAQVIYKVTWM